MLPVSKSLFTCYLYIHTFRWICIYPHTCWSFSSDQSGVRGPLFLGVQRLSSQQLAESSPYHHFTVSTDIRKSVLFLQGISWYSLDILIIYGSLKPASLPTPVELRFEQASYLRSIYGRFFISNNGFAKLASASINACEQQTQSLGFSVQ